MTGVSSLGFTMHDLGQALTTGRVRSQTHPDFPELSIYNYTENIQYSNDWDEVTLACRGLVINTNTGEIVARPWKKFFNYNQQDADIIEPTAPVEITDKMDGSLGILYRRPDGYLAIATRGSFASDQALHATDFWRREYAMYHDFNEVCDKYTFLFEVIYPDNRIVCDYGDLDDLVLLGAVHKERGEYLSPLDAKSLLGWLGPVTKVWLYPSYKEALEFPNRAGKEGVVIRDGNKIVKFKQQDYIELHRIVTNLSPKTIWGMISNGQSVESICSGIPDEFHKYVEDIGIAIIQQFAIIKLQALESYRRCITAAGGIKSAESNRREFALAAKNEQNPSLLFSLLDGKSIDDAIWKMIRPRGDEKTVGQ